MTLPGPGISDKVRGYITVEGSAVFQYITLWKCIERLIEVHNIYVTACICFFCEATRLEKLHVGCSHIVIYVHMYNVHPSAFVSHVSPSPMV